MLPGLIDGLGRALARPLGHYWGATGRLAADNLRRGRARVLLTVSTLALSLTLIGSLTGYITFWSYELFGPKFLAMSQAGRWTVSTFSVEAGLASFDELGTLRLSRDDIHALRQTLGEQVEIVEFTFVLVPELSLFGNSYFSFVLDPTALQATGTTLFSFSEGDWATAKPIIEQGCGLLLPPTVARRNGAGLGDSFTVNGPKGPVTCTVAGLGKPLPGRRLSAVRPRRRSTKAKPSHAERGVRAALAIRAGFDALEQARAAAGLPAPQFGMGLNSGLVAAGATGSEERQEYTVIGDAMNVGARIQGLTKQFADYAVLLSEFTVAALGASAPTYALTDLGLVEIRGKQEPIRIYGLNKE
ncbi:MAG: adenylate/guanylate cyclase domain-containing protein [Oscillochloridaceae bacterium umkhey_bin13]